MTFEDPYTDPATGVLRNHLGLTDKHACDTAEARLSALRIGQLEITPLPGLYDLAHLRAFHRHIFGDLYPWAGEVRVVDIARTSSFAHWRHIDTYAEYLFGRLREERHLIGLDRDTFCDRFTYYFAETNALHPFREGNGRAQRAFFRQLALHAGWQVDFALVDIEKYAEACRMSLIGPSDLLRALLDPVVSPA
ncbi:Fic/DOC family protein [Actinosynnema sp. CS-041913]|uniref:Fic/DOC family protein n=1 Tax=Actinosynnema sp. CS-041913 TaxID=3239917 RepID=UPI003D945115